MPKQITQAEIVAVLRNYEASMVATLELRRLSDREPGESPSGRIDVFPIAEKLISNRLAAERECAGRSHPQHPPGVPHMKPPNALLLFHKRSKNAAW